MESIDGSPERGIRVTPMLADYASVSDGKLTIVGGGWTEIGPRPTPFAIVTLFAVPWHLTNRTHQFRWELIDLDGNGVVPTGADEPVVVGGGFEVGRPPGVRRGTMFQCPVPIMVAPLALPSGGHFEWSLFVNDETHEDWRLAFRTRPDAQSEAA